MCLFTYCLDFQATTELSNFYNRIELFQQEQNGPHSWFIFTKSTEKFAYPGSIISV